MRIYPLPENKRLGTPSRAIKAAKDTRSDAAGKTENKPASEELDVAKIVEKVSIGFDELFAKHQAATREEIMLSFSSIDDLAVRNQVPAWNVVFEFSPHTLQPFVHSRETKRSSKRKLRRCPKDNSSKRGPGRHQHRIRRRTRRRTRRRRATNERRRESRPLHSLTFPVRLSVCQEWELRVNHSAEARMGC